MVLSVSGFISSGRNAAIQSTFPAQHILQCSLPPKLRPAVLSHRNPGGKTRRYKNGNCGKPGKSSLYLRVLPPEGQEVDHRDAEKYGEGSWPAPLWAIGRQEPAWDYSFAEA